MAFQGPIPVGKGFLLTAKEADELLARNEADYQKVVRPYLIGKDITEDPLQKPRRWIIDFATRTLEEAEEWPAALEIVRKRVKPFRDRNNRKVRREKWWLLGELVPAMRAALSPLSRYIGGTATGKRLFFCWADSQTCPSNAMNVFAFSDDYSMGVLSSGLHCNWAWSQSSTMRTDLRYTPTTVFETFPWPPVDDRQHGQVAAAAEALITCRNELCVNRGIGLTKLYNELEEGMHDDLKRLHLDLDRAVIGAYGWSESLVRDPDEANRRLLELNAAIAAGEIEYAGPRG